VKRKQHPFPEHEGGQMNDGSFQSQWQEQFGCSQPKVLCVGLNYRDHTDESGIERPTSPPLFAKFANTLCGEGDTIVLPPNIGHVDAEAELAVVIVEVARHVSAEAALSVVAGYLCANDVSAREAQFGDGQWFRGKGYDTFAPWDRGSSPRRSSEIRAICVSSSA